MKDFANYSDEELVQEIRADNMFAFDVLYRRYGKRLYKFIYSILKSSEEAENIIQEVFLSLWENRHNIEKGSSVKYYVFTIAYNSSISIIRKKLKETRFVDHLKSLQESHQEPVNIAVEFNELNDKINEIIDHLPKRQKEVYILHHNEGLKYSEIAEKLGISPNTIENHMSRALKTIREKLGNYPLFTLLFCILFV